MENGGEKGGKWDERTENEWMRGGEMGGGGRDNDERERV